MSASAPRWEPANDLEARLLDALARGDQQAYFRLMLTAQLHVPVTAPGWGRHAATWSYGQLTYLPVFTSVAALTGWSSPVAAETVGYPQLVDGWPHPAWRLAIDPHLPIGMFLRIGDVTLGAAGVLRVPTMDDLNQPDALRDLLATTADDQDRDSSP